MYFSIIVIRIVLSPLDKFRSHELKIEKTKPLSTCGISLVTLTRTILSSTLRGVLHRNNHVPSLSMKEYVLDDRGFPIIILPTSSAQQIQNTTLFIHSSAISSIFLNCSCDIGVIIHGMLQRLPKGDCRKYLSLMVDEHPHLSDIQFDASLALYRLNPLSIHLSADREALVRSIDLPQYSTAVVDEVAANSKMLLKAVNSKYTSELCQLVQYCLELSVVPDEASVAAVDRTGFIIHASYAGWPIRDGNNNPHIFIPHRGPVSGVEDALSEILKWNMDATRQSFIRRE